MDIFLYRYCFFPFVEFDIFYLFYNQAYSWHYFPLFECCKTYCSSISQCCAKWIKLSVPRDSYMPIQCSYMIGRGKDILHYVNNIAFKNFNQIRGTFENPVEGAFSFNDSRYVSWISDSDHTANNEPEREPHFTVNSNDSGYVAIYSVKSIIPKETDATFSVLSLNIKGIGTRFDYFLGLLSYLDENDIHLMPHVWKKHGSLTKVTRHNSISPVRN